MLTEEHSDWNDRIGELIRETINRAGELRDLLTMSRFLAQHEVGPLDPQLLRQIKGKPIQEAIAYLYSVLPERQGIALEAFFNTGAAREVLDNVWDKLLKISNEIAKWPTRSIDWDKVVANLPTREELNLLEEILDALDSNEFFQQIYGAFRSERPGWLGESARTFFIKQIVDRIETIVGILSGEVGRKEIAARYMGVKESLPEEPSEPSEASEKNLLDLWGEVLKILIEEFKDKQGFMKYLEGIVKQFANALRGSNRLEGLREACKEIVELYKLLPEEKQQKYRLIFQQFLETALGDSSLLTKFRTLAYLLAS
jgi:hypothetical protein